MKFADNVPTVYICRARCLHCGSKRFRALRSVPLPDGTQERRCKCLNEDCQKVFKVNVDYVPFIGVADSRSA